MVEAGGHFLRKDVAEVLATADAAGIDLGQLGLVNLGGPLPLVDRPAPVSELADIEAIKQLKARYFRFIDTKDWDAFADLFTEDCDALAPTDDGAAHRPRNDEYCATSDARSTGVTTVHHGHMPEITIVGRTRPTGIWAMFDDVEIPGGRRTGCTSRATATTSRPTGKCDDGKWRISSKRNVRLRVDEVP